MEAFTPGSPIDEVQLFAGRAVQISQMVETVFQRGQHAVLYGERGVGKSSLANTFSKKLSGPGRAVNSVIVNCDPSDDYSSIWRKVFRRFLDNADTPISDRYPGAITPDDVLVEFMALPLAPIPIVILDEFDQIRDKDAKVLIANTIKYLSDRGARVTVIIVGVADSVGILVEDHQSISRCLRQVPMQRMAPSELTDIIKSRLVPQLMDVRGDALAYIIALARGLPHYAHLIGQKAAIHAIKAHKLIVELDHVEAALPQCVQETSQMIREQYHEATLSPRKDNIYKEVLLAAALSNVDDLGYFQPVALCKPLAELLGKPSTLVAVFGQHLKILCAEDRGKILEVTGTVRRFRYRFVEPMMQPFILMSGLQNGTITRDQIGALAANYYEPRLSTDF